MSLELQQCRDEWVRRLTTMIVSWGTDDLDAVPPVHPGLGPPELVLAALIARIVSQAAGATPRQEIIAAVETSRMLSTTAPRDSTAGELVDVVLRQMARGSLPGPVPWDPPGTSRTLIEVWAAQRGAQVPLGGWCFSRGGDRSLMIVLGD